MSELTLRVSPLAPFRLDLTVWLLRRRPHNALDFWDGRCYRRAFIVAGAPAIVSVRQSGPPGKPRLQVKASARQPLGSHRDELVAILERTLGLRLDLREFYELSRADSKLGPLVSRFVGFRPPRFPTVFETLANAIACQQLSLEVGLTLLNRLARTFTEALGHGDSAPLAFPPPARLAGADPRTMRALGFSRQKSRALLQLARRCADDQECLEGLGLLDDEQAMARLLALEGVGRWSAEYVMLRGLGRLDFFPGDDLAGQKNLARWLQLRKKPDHGKAQRLLARWRPYRGLIYLNFLLAGLEARGLIAATPTSPRRTES